MKITGNTVLITGGATGIGLALAEAFLNENNEVIIVGRRKRRLQQAKRQLPEAHTRCVDVSNEFARQKLFLWVSSEFSKVNILVNNAGIQRKLDFTSRKILKSVPSDDEIAINLVAPIRLCALFTPALLRRKNAAIVNVSSGLAFVPIASMPIYCATKAALHSFTVSLRHQLRNSTVRVFEAAPPATDTELDKSFAGEREHAHRGITAREVAAAIMGGLRADNEQIIIGQAQELYESSLRDPLAAFKRLNDYDS